jgi:hypothetical protein
MSLQEYYDQLDAHDWFYSFTDEHRVFMVGEHASANLISLANTDEKRVGVYATENCPCCANHKIEELRQDINRLTRSNAALRGEVTIYE